MEPTLVTGIAKVNDIPTAQGQMVQARYSIVSEDDGLWLYFEHILRVNTRPAELTVL